MGSFVTILALLICEIKLSYISPNTSRSIVQNIIVIITTVQLMICLLYGSYYDTVGIKPYVMLVAGRGYDLERDKP